MAGTGWRQDRPLIDQLMAEPERFDPFEAIRLMELDAARSDGGRGEPVASGTDSRRECVRFSGNLAAAFPVGDLQEIRRTRSPSGRTRFTVRVAFMSLAGHFGPLPQPLVERVGERARAGDHAMRDFLDIFNHRLVALMVRARRAHRPELNLGPPWTSNLSTYLAALCGIGVPPLKGRLPVPDRSLFRHAGLLSRGVASPHGLERILTVHFGLPVTVLTLTGEWLPLEPEDRTLLGTRADATRLGRGAVLGRRVWDQTAGITIALWNLTLRQYLSFLPDGRGARELAALVAFHAGPALSVTLSLRMRAASVPPLRLGKGRGAVLGRTSYLAAVAGKGSAMDPPPKTWALDRIPTV